MIYAMGASGDGFVVLLDEHNFIARKLHDMVKVHHERKEELPPRLGATFIPVTGLKPRPRRVYLPKKPRKKRQPKPKPNNWSTSFRWSPR